MTIKTVTEKPYLIIASMTVFICFVMACQDIPLKRLSSYDGAVIFTLPAQYKPSDADEKLITFAFRYPSMEPILPGMTEKDDQIKIHIRRTQTPKRSSANYATGLEARAAEKFDPRRRNLEYWTGHHGIYRTYQQGSPQLPNAVNTYYVFEAKDRQMVYVKDAHFTATTKVHRTIDYRFDVQYTVAKALGNNFIKFDNIVTTLINRNTTVRPFL
ncbi:hypothetical protein [Glaciimonas sp. PCH181]|uniref:hypothetical protein n=1 Tax=Glaciimonas sp. PCH181 TaxID=2133943 RepID=UPI000D3953E5|nr:hypothetical protein [Glaciimonas sp. PCH181]PUA18811.1 hypothetical protein C7W93_02530 [Glaciimonas sp. PCH181]